MRPGERVSRFSECLSQGGELLLVTAEPQRADPPGCRRKELSGLLSESDASVEAKWMFSEQWRWECVS